MEKSRESLEKLHENRGKNADQKKETKKEAKKEAGERLKKLGQTSENNDEKLGESGGK